MWSGKTGDYYLLHVLSKVDDVAPREVLEAADGRAQEVYQALLLLHHERLQDCQEVVPAQSTTHWFVL